MSQTIDYGDLHDFVAKKYGKGEAERIILLIENALDVRDLANRHTLPLRERYITARTRLDTTLV